ncbi:MAG: class I SAM-dependent methyltransferase [Acidobacteriota bacterium]|nr:MAG: class I SAM-dependent methyltransferase [Acidobacteriota bacterium]
MLAVARQLHTDIEFRAGSADALPFEDEEFDAVVGNFVLHHMARPEMVLNEAFRVLRGDGRMGFTIWEDPSKLEAFGLFFASVEEHCGASELPHGPLFGVSDFEFLHTMVRDTGFCESSVRELDIAWRLGSLEPFLAAFGAWANMDAFPSEIRTAIEDTVRERANDYVSDDGFVMPNPAILISAVK